MITDKKIKELQLLLDQSGEPHMPVDLLQGFLASVAIGPHVVPPRLWLPPVFSSDDELPTFSKKSNPEQILLALMNFYNDTLQDIQDDSLEPIISIYENDENEEEDFSNWCSGFSLGMGFWGPDWDEQEDNEELLSLVLPILYLANPELFALENEQELTAELENSIDDLVQGLPLLVSLMWSYWAERRKPMPVRANRIGRNEPCPCGSGKKYKKCCGRSQ